MRKNRLSSSVFAAILSSALFVVIATDAVAENNVQSPSIVRPHSIIQHLEAELNYTMENLTTPDGIKTYYLNYTVYDEYQAVYEKPERSPERAPNAPRTNKKEEKEEKKRKGGNVSVLVDIWNEVLGERLHKVRKPISAAREKSLLARFKDQFGGDPQKWRSYLERIKASDFLMGRTEQSGEHKNWKPDFDWCVKPSSCEKIMEGKYDNRKGNGGGKPLTPHEQAMFEWIKGGEEGEEPKAGDYPAS